LTRRASAVDELSGDFAHSNQARLGQSGGPGRLKPSQSTWAFQQIAVAQVLSAADKNSLTINRFYRLHHGIASSGREQQLS
jgi:hypothetical protein